MKDSIVNLVINKFIKRSEVGQKKYNTTLDRDDLNFEQWLTHLQEEIMDATLYIEKLKSELDKDDSFIITKESWVNSEKITHEGFVYVKLNDLKRI